MTNDEPWAAYLDEFHEVHPGITEDVLRQAHDDGATPYRWLADATPRQPGREEVLLDLACGSGPLREALVDARWVGLDRSRAELRRAATLGGPLIAGDAGAIPIRSQTIDAVLCSMALMIIEPLEPLVAEVARVLRPGGALVALVPGEAPLTLLDRLRYLRLLAAVRRRRLDYPNRVELEDPARLFAAHGLRLHSDERRRFAYPTGGDAAELLVRSLYLPGTPEAQRDRAMQMARSWRGSDIGIPLRRLVWRRGPVVP